MSLPPTAEHSPAPSNPPGNPRQTPPPSKNVVAVQRIVESPLGWGILRFGTPLVVGMVLHTLFNLVDLFMISRLPNATAAVAALGICDMVAAVATILSNGVSTASVALISRHLGSNHLTALRRATYQSLWLVAFLSVVFGAIGIFGSDWIVRNMMFTKGQAAELAVPYLQVILGGCFSIFLLLQVTAILRALGHAKTAAMLLVGGNALNILLNVFFIYGSGPAPAVFAWGGPVAEALGIPRMGVVGAAWATLIARTVPVLIGLWILANRRGGPRFHWVYLRPFVSELASIVKIAWPSSAQLVLRVGVTLFFIGLVNAEFTTPEDQSALTAYSICLRLETMVLLIGMGWGAAASSFVGTNLGAGIPKRAKNAGWVTAGYDLVLTLGVAALYMMFIDRIVGFFDPSAEVVAIGREYVHAVALTYAALGVAIVLSQAMQGAGATLSSLVLDAIVMLLIVVPVAYVVGATLDLPRRNVWLVIGAGNVLSAIGYAIYYARGSFLRKRIG